MGRCHDSEAQDFSRLTPSARPSVGRWTLSSKVPSEELEKQDPGPANSIRNLRWLRHRWRTFGPRRAPARRDGLSYQYATLGFGWSATGHDPS